MAGPPGFDGRCRGPAGSVGGAGGQMGAAVGADARLSAFGRCTGAWLAVERCAASAASANSPALVYRAVGSLGIAAWTTGRTDPLDPRAARPPKAGSG